MAEALPPRFSMVFDFESRDGGLSKDALITNGFAEKDTSSVFLRPGVATYKAAVNTTGQGLLIGTGAGTTGMWRVSGGILYSGVA